MELMALRKLQLSTCDLFSYTVFIWLDATPQIVAALRGPTIDFGNNGLKIVYPYQMVVEFEQSPHQFLGLR